MKTKHIFLAMVAFAATACFAQNQKQTIDVTNDTNQVLHFAANTADQNFKVSQTVPAYTRAIIIAQLVNLKSVQNMLLEAILNDSVAGIQEAVRKGANINQEIGGQRPLIFAIALEKIGAVKCLVALGAY